MALTDPLFDRLFSFPTFTFSAISKLDVIVVPHNDSLKGKSLSSNEYAKVGGRTVVQIFYADFLDSVFLNDEAILNSEAA